MYDLAGYGAMIADAVRIGALFEALKRVVRPGFVVVDVGAGTGVLSLMACRLGARRVYAIEVNDLIELGKQNAQANGYADRIEFIHAYSTDVTLPERCDVLISEMHGALPFYASYLESIADARRRFLSPTGALVPVSDTLWAVVAENPIEYDRYVSFWSREVCGLDLSSGVELAKNNWWRTETQADGFLTTPSCWATLDFRSIESSNVSGVSESVIAREGIAHGLCLWFDMNLTDEVSLSNHPESGTSVYGRIFLPFSCPVPVEAGDSVRAALSVSRITDAYLWRWETEIRTASHRALTKASFKQSTLYGSIFSPSALRKTSETHVPERNNEGELDLFVLSRMNGVASLGEIATLAQTRFPGRLGRPADALARVAMLSEKYSR